MKWENVRNERMIEKDVMESCLQRMDDREGCNGRVIVTEGSQRRMSRQQKKEGGTLSQMYWRQRIELYKMTFSRK